jgi:peptidoglycan hydrolase CwlO-like protein
MVYMRKRKILLFILIVFFVLADAGIFAVSARAEEDVEDIKDEIEEMQDEKERAEKELQAAQTNLQKTQAQINVTKSLIQKTQGEIARSESEVKNLNTRLELNKGMLENYIREAYYVDEDPLIEFAVGDNSITGLTENFDQLLGVKDKIVSILGDINEAKAQLEETKIQLADKKEDHEKLYSVQQGQQYEIKTDIVEVQATLSELNAKIEKLRGELSNLLGSSVSFKSITEAAKFASQVTGIRKDYLLGVLVVESNLGRYTGGCNFKESRMSGYRATVFKQICEDLDYDYKKKKVSCPPSGYKGTGGAMGVAQFMPDTWMGYKSSIASVVHHTPDPWDLTDGVVAMALKLTKVDGVKQHKKSAEAKAYCVYLAGGNWAAYCDSKGVNYGQKVLYWADNYEKLMD